MNSPTISLISIFPQAHIKLNPKKLYQSDGYSVKELLKVIFGNIYNVKCLCEQS